MLKNDRGLADTPVTVAILGTLSNGSARVAVNTTIAYTPAKDYVGTDDVNYRVTDADNETATASVAVTSTCDTCAAGKLELKWDPNPEPVKGYRVFYGPAPTNTPTLAEDIPIDKPGFDPQALSTALDAWNDLRLNTGANVCFRIKAYDDTQASIFSGPICGKL